MSYPRDLMKHLRNLNKTDANCRITIENNADGIYNIHGETFITQIIVASRLSPEENKFLRCICDGASNPTLFKEVADDCETNAAEKATKEAIKEANKRIRALIKEKQSLAKEKKSQAHTIKVLQELLIQNGIPLPE